MEYVRLGHSGLKVGRIALGCMSFGDPTLGMHSWTLDEEASQPFFRSRYLVPWQQPSLVGPSDELGSGTEIQLPQDVVDVCLHRPGRDAEPGGDLAVGHSSGDQLGNLRFATGQPLPRWHRSPGLSFSPAANASSRVSSLPSASSHAAAAPAVVRA